MGAKRGRRKITSRPRSFITLQWTMRSLTTFTARNRTTLTLALRAELIGVRWDRRIGSWQAAVNAASAAPIRATGASFIQRKKVTLLAPVKVSRKWRTLAAGRLMTRDM